jgi:2-dehydro-3-deoxyphosphogluconate aldolase/(4S)-4-hydroxy-2-oxoglutarate aldolase
MTSISHFRVIPVLVIEDASWASDLGTCLVQSGLPVVEVTLRTPQSWSAAEAMRKIRGLTVGIGSVTKVSDLARGKDLGVDFAVSAGIRRDLVEGAAKIGMNYFPGVATPSEILLATELELSTVKWFPAETLGGINALKAMSAPFPAMTFIPTGGINGDNAPSYLKEKSVKAVGGSWMFPREAMSAKNLDVIASEARSASQIAGGS